MRAVAFNEDVRAATHQAAAAKGFSVDFVAGCLEAIALDIGWTYDELILRPPGESERRTYAREAEALGIVEAVCEDHGDEVVVINLRIGAFS